MPTGPRPDLDAQRAALARQWFAELRQRGRDEADACGDGDGGD